MAAGDEAFARPVRGPVAGQESLTIDARGWRPSFDSFRQYTDAWCMVLNVPYMCTLTTESNSSGVIENIILSRRMPALFTSTSSRPNASIAVLMMFPAPSYSATLS